MNGVQNSINGQHLTDDQRLEMLKSLSPENQQLVAEFVEAITPKPAHVPVESVEDVERKILLMKFRQLSTDEQTELLEEMREEAAQTSPASEPEQPPTEALETAENASVHTIAKSIMSRLLTNEVGAQLFPMGIVGFENKSDVFEGIYLDLVEGIISGLAGCDMNELHTAAHLGSLR